ncbi:hypothetical protein LZ009_14930 [Ramlibacter sp. XY19]|uniref:hypothetical protein n=1 Tax=Ramlibacter paludis TaxID=2908000 RepID=UPI0023DBF0CD|nr:hypothetical protein [Ramlibacter paludis]MCG2594073.1 hypothetical protein [Ramlibacter paludis]
MPQAAAVVILLLAVAASLAVRPWRLLRGGALATPLLAALALLPWLWAWPALAGMPMALQWSAAPLLVLLLGWPLAVLALVAAGLGTMLVAGASFAQAVAMTLWSGVLPATAMLILGYAIRAIFGTNPASYLAGRAFAAPLVALLFCDGLAAAFGHGPLAQGGGLQYVAALLLSMGEAGWTCAVASALVACRPEWLATWSDRLYLSSGATPSPLKTTRPRRRNGTAW